MGKEPSFYQGLEKWPEKAYKNLTWLNSPDARLVRIMCEFAEPLSRFRRLGVRNTVVFFGSARILSPVEAQSRLDALERAVGNSVEPTPEQADEIARAKHAVAMARYYGDAVELAQRLTEWSLTLPNNGRHFLVCSGGGPGIMEAANLGASLAAGQSVSLNISLPHEQAPNAFQTQELAFEFHYFFMRKFWFVYLAKALVVFPGGFGTLDELFEVITLLQTSKAHKPMPIVVYGSEYWKSIVNFEALVANGMIERADLDLLRFCDSVDEAFAYLEERLTHLYLSSDTNHNHHMPGSL